MKKKYIILSFFLFIFFITSFAFYNKLSPHILTQKKNSNLVQKEIKELAQHKVVNCFGKKCSDDSIFKNGLNEFFYLGIDDLKEILPDLKEVNFTENEEHGCFEFNDYQFDQFPKNNEDNIVNHNIKDRFSNMCFNIGSIYYSEEGKEKFLYIQLSATDITNYNKKNAWGLSRYISFKQSANNIILHDDTGYKQEGMRSFPNEYTLIRIGKNKSAWSSQQSLDYQGYIFNNFTIWLLTQGKFKLILHDTIDFKDSDYFGSPSEDETDVETIHNQTSECSGTEPQIEFIADDVSDFYPIMLKLENDNSKCSVKVEFDQEKFNYDLNYAITNSSLVLH